MTSLPRGAAEASFQASNYTDDPLFFATAFLLFFLPGSVQIPCFQNPVKYSRKTRIYIPPRPRFRRSFACPVRYTNFTRLTHRQGGLIYHSLELGTPLKLQSAPAHLVHPLIVMSHLSRKTAQIRRCKIMSRLRRWQHPPRVKGGFCVSKPGCSIPPPPLLPPARPGWGLRGA
jgi:hypothetical protein